MIKSLSKTNQEEAVKLLYSNLFLGLFITVVTSAMLVFGFNNSSQHHQKIIWWLTMVFICLLRWAIKVLYTRNTSRGSVFYLRVFSACALITACMWSFYSLYFYQQAGPIELTATMVVMAGFASGSSSTLSAHRITALAYVFILIVPYSTLLVLSGNEVNATLGYLGFFFVLIILTSTYRASGYILDAITIKNQNAQLLLKMEKKVEERTQAFITLSNIDSLTGLPNRHAFLIKLNALMLQNPNHPLAVLFIDLDGFKSINDTLGHEVGDHVIHIAASRIKNSHSKPLLLCRWGGDEFLAVVNHQDKPDTTKLAQCIIDEVSLPYFHNSYRVIIGATIGISIYPEHSRRKEELIQHADMAMYQQKRLEKGAVGYFNEKLRLQIQREFSLRDKLINAIEKNEFSLAYQPIINAKTGKADAFEALLRWNSDQGLIPPDLFIPIAEQYGQIKNIGLWVMNEACQQAKVFRDISPRLSICVNVSVSQFQDEDFVDKISAIFQAHDFDPSGLNIEITESVFASDRHSLVKQIKALQKMGIKISIDDFGTGYSSLSSMLDLGVDNVKIDKSFINTIHSSGLSIITAVMHIANELGFQVVAEGVESEQQAKVLRSLNVTHLQGYYFSFPMEKGKAIDYLTNQ